MAELKKAVPIPVIPIMIVGRIQCESTFKVAPTTRTAIETITPAVAGILGPTLSVKYPHNGDRAMVKMGGAKNMNPIEIGEIKRIPWR